MSVTKVSISDRKPVFTTPWFELIGKKIENDPAPHYSIRTPDYVSVFAVTTNGTFPLVRQFRPAVEDVTLELPCGHVDQGETPEQAFAAHPPMGEPSTAPSAKLPITYPNGLTAREVEILRLVAQGLTNDQIAEQLIISPRTVNTHLTSIYGKIGASSRGAATRYAIEHHLA